MKKQLIRRSADNISVSVNKRHLIIHHLTSHEVGASGYGIWDDGHYGHV